MQLAYTAVVLDVSFSSQFSPNELIKIEQFENAKIKNILSVLDTYNNQQEQNLIIYSRQKKIIVLIGSKSKQLEDIAVIKELVNNMIRIVESNVSNVTLIAGIGKQYPHIIDISNSFYEAQATLRILKESAPKRTVSHYDDFRLRHFLNRNIKSDEMNDFINEVLGPLIAHDLEHQSDLVNTLEVWVNNSLNTAQAARALFVHRNTMLYRISKIKELLQFDIEQPEELMSIQLALNLRHLLLTK